LVQGVASNFVVRATDVSANLRRLVVADVPSGVGGLARAELWNLPTDVHQLAGIDFTQPPTITTNFATINYSDAGGQPFWPGAQVDRFAARFTGDLSIPVGGGYTFWINSDDGSRLLLDGRVALDNDGEHGATERSVTIALSAGIHSFELLFFENGGGALIQASIAGPGFGKRLVQSSDFGFFAAQQFVESAGPSIQSPTDMAVLEGTLRLQRYSTNDVQIRLAATDADGIVGERIVRVVTLSDLDGDGIPDRDDSDIDGDGVSNADEIAAGTDPRNPDTDGDGVPDGSDPHPLATNHPPLFAGGAALAFDGTDDYVQFGSPAALQMTGDQTIELWLRPQDFSQVRNTISKAYAGEGSMSIATDGRVNYFYGIRGDDGGVNAIDYQSFTSSFKLARDGWSHLAVVRDLSSMKLRWYLNGALMDEVPALFHAAKAGSQPFLLGRGYAFPFLGQMDEVRIWNRARTGDEIRASRFSHVLGNEPGLVVAWSFDETSGSVVRDVGPSRVTGILGDGVPAFAPSRVASDVPVGSVLTQTPIPGTPRHRIQLTPVDPDGDPVTLRVTALPSHGALYQTVDGTTPGAAVSVVPAVVTDPSGRLIYESTAGFSGIDSLGISGSDGYLDSWPATGSLLLLPPNQPPVAAADAFSTFQDTAISIAGVTGNDTDPDGDPLRFRVVQSPAHGTLVTAASGSASYAPDPGFSGSDQFTYALVDRVAWIRSEQYRKGITHNATTGNPWTDAFGLPTWRLDFLEGGTDLAGASPWYLYPGNPMMWDSSWYYGDGLWAFRDDFGAAIWNAGMAHNLTGTDWNQTIPSEVWVSPFLQGRVDVFGDFDVEWHSTAATADADVVLAVRSRATQVVTPLYTNTFSRPAPASSSDVPRTTANLWVRDVAVGLGDEVVFTVRGRGQAGGWITVVDRLVIAPSAASRYATVTLQVRGNHTPVVAASEGSALQFDGVDDTLLLPAGAPDAAWTVEAWVRPDRIQGGRHGVAGYFAEGADWGVALMDGELCAVARSGEITRSGVLAQPGRWYHVAAARAGLAIQVYVNGQLRREGTIAGDYTPGRGAPPRVGSETCCSSYFAGLVDEVRIWNRALAPDEIAQGVYLPLSGTEPGLLGYYPLDEGTGLAAANHASASASGTLGAGNASAVPRWVASDAPFDRVPSTLEDHELVLTVAGSDQDGDTLTPVLTSPPQQGTLYQTPDGVVRGTPIVFNTAARLDGAREYLQVPETTNTDLGFHATWSITAWILPAAVNNQYSTIFADGYWTISFGLQQGTARLDSWFNNGNNVQSDRSLDLGRWQHVALVYDGSARHLYIDGQPAGTAAGGAPGVGGSGASIGGVTSDAAGNWRSFFDGAIDEVALWGRALSDAEIKTAATTRPTGTESDLLAFWNFDPVRGSSVPDASGHEADALYVGLAGSPGLQLVGNTATALDPLLPRVTNPSGKVIYVPSTNRFGLDSLGYRISDGKVSSSDGTASWRVIPVNDPPTAVPDVVSVAQGLPQVIVDVTANDFDADGDPFTLLDYTQPSHGALVITGGGGFIYTPAPGFTGTDSFTYRVTDGQATSEPGVVQLVVDSITAFRWINPAGGAWSQASNWSPSRLPGSNDTVVIDLPGTYTVSQDVPATVRRVIVGGDSGQATLAVNSVLTNLTDSFVRAGGRLALAGRLTLGGRLTVDGAFDWQGGVMEGPGTTEWTPGAVVSLATSGDRYLIGGRVLLNRTTAVMAAGRLILQNGPLGTPRVENAGSLTLARAASVVLSDLGGGNHPLVPEQRPARSHRCRHCRHQPAVRQHGHPAD
jgi:hypothetical protein